jgi:hypothetical protein
MTKAMDRHRIWRIAGLCFALFGVALIVFWAATNRDRQNRYRGERAPRHDDLQYETYTNARFRYSLCYPKQILVPEGEAPNADGQRFVTADKQTLVFVYGSNNVLGQTPAEILAQNSDDFRGGKVTINKKSLGEDSFTFLGTIGNRSVFEKTLFRNGQTKTLDIEYPTSLVVTYEPLVAHMAACFRNTN